MSIVCVDEVGRGCLFGPVVAAAVIIPESWCIASEAPDGDIEPSRIRDSKKVGIRERAKLDSYIRTHAIAYGIGVASVEEIDSMNILQATYTAMHRALDQVYEKIPFTKIRVDGNSFRPYRNIPYTCIISGDASDKGIAAASILAKEYRDSQIRSMVAADPTLEKYGIHSNMGYGTSVHMKAIREHGITIHHRRSFAPCANAITNE